MALLRAALTGGIATGKSYVRTRLRGARHPDARRRRAGARRRRARHVRPGGGGRALRGRRPPGRRQRSIAAPSAPSCSRDAQARADLEAIIHPRVREATGTWLDRLAAAGESLAVVDIPLLYETGRDRDFDRVIVTSCPRSQQVARVVERDGLTAAAGRGRGSTRSCRPTTRCSAPTS